MKPSDNYRVIQDDNPVKKAVMKEAERRSEKTRDTNSDYHNTNMFYHYKKIEDDASEFERERTMKKNKQ